MGQANALAVLAVGDKGCFLNAPDMYMEKLIVGPGAKGAIDLICRWRITPRNIADALVNRFSWRSDRDYSGKTAS